MRNIVLVALALAFCASANAQRKTEIVEPVNVPSADEGLVLKRKVAIGRFSNETQYAKGIFYDKENDNGQAGFGHTLCQTCGFW